VDNRDAPQLGNFRLKVFRVVAEKLNFRKAAERVFLTQPAITLQIKALEDDLGVRLFNRGAGQVSLTREGAIPRRYAQQISAIVAQAEHALAAGQAELSEEIELGISTTIAQYVHPRLLTAFLRENPGVRLFLHSGNIDQIVDFVLKDKVFRLPDRRPTVPPGHPLGGLYAGRAGPHHAAGFRIRLFVPRSTARVKSADARTRFRVPPCG